MQVVFDYNLYLYDFDKDKQKMELFDVGEKKASAIPRLGDRLYFPKGRLSYDYMQVVLVEHVHEDIHVYAVPIKNEIYDPCGRGKDIRQFLQKKMDELNAVGG